MGTEAGGILASPQGMFVQIILYHLHMAETKVHSLVSTVPSPFSDTFGLAVKYCLTMASFALCHEAGKLSNLASPTPCSDRCGQPNAMDEEESVISGGRKSSFGGCE